MRIRARSRRECLRRAPDYATSVPDGDLSAATTVSRASQAIAEPVFGDLVVLDPTADRYVRLNESGAVLWEALGSPATIGDLARLIAERFGIDDERALADTTAFVRELAGRELVALEHP